VQWYRSGEAVSSHAVAENPCLPACLHAGEHSIMDFSAPSCWLAKVQFGHSWVIQLSIAGAFSGLFTDSRSSRSKVPQFGHLGTCS
jgi:hypothetical protein